MLRSKYLIQGLEALKADRPINKLLLSKGIGRHSVIGQILYHARQSGILVEYVDPRLLQKLSPTGHSQGVLAMVATKDYIDINDLLEASRNRDNPALYILLQKEHTNLDLLYLLGDQCFL